MNLEEDTEPEKIDIEGIIKRIAASLEGQPEGSFEADLVTAGIYWELAKYHKWTVNRVAKVYSVTLECADDGTWDVRVEPKNDTSND